MSKLKKLLVCICTSAFIFGILPVLGFALTEVSASTRVDISALKTSLEYRSVVYDGTEKTPEITIKDGDYKLVNGTDFNAVYARNVKAGTAAVTVRGIEKYKGRVTLNFKIARASQRPSITISKNRIAVNGSARVRVKGIGEVTYASSDTAVAEVNEEGTVTAKSPGTVKITAKCAGNRNYKAKSVSVRLTSVPAKTKITGIENVSKGIRLNWAESAGAEGYYIYRSVKGTKYTLIKTVKGGSSVQATDQTVVSGKNYYYKIRPYSGELKGEVCGIKSCFRLDRPIINGLTNPSAGKVTVTWKKVKKADGYIVTAIIGGEEKTYRITGLESTSKTITGVKNGAVCKFYIRAWKDFNGKVSYSQGSAGKAIKARENYLTVSGSGSTRTIELVNPTVTYESVEAAVWSETGEQDDLVWYTMSINDNGSWSAQASASVIEHPGLCQVHCYADGGFVSASSFKLTKSEQKNAVNPKIQEYARNLLDKAGWTLREAYDWSKKLPYQSMAIPLTVPKRGKYAGFNRQELYFVYAYEYGKGNCFCCAASFYWMARELGYEARLIEGSCKNGAHGWVEIDLNGVTYLCDPETEGALGYDSYMKTYENGPPMEYVKVRPY